MDGLRSDMIDLAPAAFWIRTRPWAIKILELVPLLALLLVFNVAGLRGIDYGYHWDEPDFQMEPTRHMVKTGVFLPQAYIYPTFAKWLIMLPAAVHGVRAAIDSNGSPIAIQAAMLAEMDALHPYLLSARSLFVVISSLAIIWVYGAALALRHRWWEALVAAACLGASWEYSYHARWVVTDCIVVQFAALGVFLLALFRLTARPLFLYGAALAAGLATGTKYTGVFLLVPVLIAGVLSLPVTQLWAQAKRGAAVCALAFGVYLLSTPATVLEPFRFVTETRSISTYYQHTHGGYTADSALTHMRIVLNYFAFAYFSPYHWLALVSFVGVLCGALLWLKRDLRFGATIVGFPLFFLLFFCIRYRVVMVRNYLFLAPFLALLLTRAVSDFYQWLPRRWFKAAFGSALVAMLVVQCWFVVSAGESIRFIDPRSYAREALRYVADHPSISFRVSDQVRTLAKAQSLPLPRNVDKAGSQVVFFGRAEGPGPWNWMVNDPWLTEAVFGPREINFNWYSSWSGHDHVVVMTLDKARSTGVPLAR